MQWDVSQVQDETTPSASINKTSTGFSCHDTSNLWGSHNMPKPYSRCITVSSVSMDPWQPWPSTRHHPESRKDHDWLELAVWLHGHHSSRAGGIVSEWTPYSWATGDTKIQIQERYSASNKEIGQGTSAAVRWASTGPRHQRCPPGASSNEAGRSRPLMRAEIPWMACKGMRWRVIWLRATFLRQVDAVNKLIALWEIRSWTLETSRISIEVSWSHLKEQKTLRSLCHPSPAVLFHSKEPNNSCGKMTLPSNCSLRDLAIRLTCTNCRTLEAGYCQNGWVI